MGNNIILETKFVADISGSFYIPSYQRGYRWSETEVVRLLDDIYQNGKKNYCLQPVVVRKKEDQYELIDGQQRLTTLYLIYKYMKNVNPFFNEPAFTLSYQTRDQSEEFLKTLDMTKQDDNIDFWHLISAISMHCTQPVLKSSQLVTEPSAGLEQEFFLTKQSMMLIFS